MDQQPSFSGQQPSSIQSRQQTEPNGKQILSSSPSVQHYLPPCPRIKGPLFVNPHLRPPQNSVTNTQGKSATKRIGQLIGQQVISKFPKVRERKCPLYGNNNNYNNNNNKNSSTKMYM